MSAKSDTVQAVCDLISSGDIDHAARLAKAEYPFVPSSVVKRSYRQLESTLVFLSDGFLDRYSGERLIYPPVLRVMSLVIPTEIPFHPNWKTSATHPAYWEVGATVDHIIPVTRGGADTKENWVTTSMIRNFSKMNWTLEELGWELLPRRPSADWDGMFAWFLDYANRHPAVTRSGNIGQWYQAAREAEART